MMSGSRAPRELNGGGAPRPYRVGAFPCAPNNSLFNLQMEKGKTTDSLFCYRQNDGIFRNTCIMAPFVLYLISEDIRRVRMVLMVKIMSPKSPFARAFTILSTLPSADYISSI